MGSNVIFLLAVLAFSCVAGQKVVFKDCGSKTASVTEVRVIPCPQEPCVFKRNTTVRIEMDFKSNVNTTTAKASLHGIIGGVPLPFPLPNNDACKSGVKCPVKMGDVNTYSMGVLVKPVYPKLKVVVKLELQDDTQTDMVCVLLPAEITD